MEHGDLCDWIIESASDEVKNIPDLISLHSKCAPAPKALNLKAHTLYVSCNLTIFTNKYTCMCSTALDATVSDYDLSTKNQCVYMKWTQAAHTTRLLRALGGSERWQRAKMEKKKLWSGR